MSIVIMRDWALAQGPGSAYDAPEVRGTAVQGVISGHPEIGDGNHIVSSRVVRAAGRDVFTASGRQYRLDGPPKAAFVEFMAAAGLPFDPDNPLPGE